ncbi:SulP family inorganic anion transporter [Pararhodospirillum oryzae]|uniref:Sodium-independent anion transporter n=1 Tax=Pararhodospirillum oryzae TaxID=478448 RepID=A0A512H6X6_9PROT|nr:SulP family inorganic anion transporter [Pararhodospirillum oryzae]GEO81225.1 sodium-independent anion transporter [Pararhodospirillum oryzae]
MTSSPPTRPVAPSQPGFIELFTPKLITVLREGYRWPHLRADALAGLSVAIVALPLSTAIAIASGVTPDRGLYTAIVGGLLISLLGGSRFQIGGPAGAFIVLVATTVHTHGLDGLLLAVFLSGLLLMALGFLRLGTYVKYLPYPVTIGFTAGIGVIIFTSQIKELLGLTLAGPEPGPFLEKLPALWAALPTVHLPTLGLSALTIALLVGLKRWRPHWPGLLIAIALTSALAAVFNLPVETIGSRFGGIPTGLPAPHLPDLSWAKVQAVMPAAVSFALLGAIESLLSAVVADSMTGRNHRSNCELVAQGIANMGSSVFGGICVTGTIARTATNVRAGAHGPMAGVFHALTLLAFILVAAPLGDRIPLAALAGVLAILAWNMVERHAITTLVRASWGDAVVLLATLGLTVLRDLTEAILIGFALGALVFIRRMSQATEVEALTPLIPGDRADGAPAERTPYDARAAQNRSVAVYRITGAFFFGAAASVGSALERIADAHSTLIIDFSAVPFLDSTAAKTIEGLAQKAERRGRTLVLTGASIPVRRALLAHGVRPPLVTFAPSIEDALPPAPEAAAP